MINTIIWHLVPTHKLIFWTPNAAILTDEILLALKLFKLAELLLTQISFSCLYPVVSENWVSGRECVKGKKDDTQQHTNLLPESCMSSWHLF